MIVPPGPGADLLRVTAHLPAPALVYDLDAVAATVATLREDLSPFGEVQLLFAVKANRCPTVLDGMAALGLGGNVASATELGAALTAGLTPLSVTSPVLSAGLMERAQQAGAQIYLDNLAQVGVWGANAGLSREIGLRLRVPLEASNRSSDDRTGWSRFGLDPADRTLHQLLSRHRLNVTSLHIHAGEIRDPARAQRLAALVVAAQTVFPETESVNLGGGLTYLCADYFAAREAFTAMAATLKQSPCKPRVIFEPGMLLVALAGCLLAEVVDVRPSLGGARHVTLDASAWNLATWSVPRFWASFPARWGPTMAHDFAGNTCYEQDYFARQVDIPELCVGDRVLLSGFGAYAASMARCSHGIAQPPEWVLSNGRLISGNRDDVRL
jgi:diaminopimelate decarboxylase